MMEGMPVRVSVANSMAATSLLVLGVLRQVDRRPHAQGQDDEQGDHHEIDGVDDVGRMPMVSLSIAGLGGQEGPS